MVVLPPPQVVCCAFLGLFLLLAKSDAAERNAAMWVYETDALITSETACKELIKFCQQRHIADLFWSTHFPPETKSGPETRIPDRPELRGFLAEAARAHIRVHALSGDPADLLPKNRERALGRVDAVVRFNKAGPLGAGFAGIHLDIEPHAQPSWMTATPMQRGALLTQMVELHAAGARRLHQQAPDLIYGADVVFWLSKKNADGRPAYPVKFEGVDGDAETHLLGLVDHLAVMCYRNYAEGRNGVIDLVRGTITRGDRAQAKVFLGLKMARIGPPIETFYGRKEDEMQRAVSAIDDAFGEHPSYAGVAYFMYAAYREMVR